MSGYVIKLGPRQGERLWFLLEGVLGPCEGEEAAMLCERIMDQLEAQGVARVSARGRQRKRERAEKRRPS